MSKIVDFKQYKKDHNLPELNNLTKLNDFKELKKIKLITKDLEQIMKVMNLTLLGLEKYTKYSPVAESVSIIKQNRIIIQLYLNKCNTILKGKE